MFKSPLSVIKFSLKTEQQTTRPNKQVGLDQTGFHLCHIINELQAS